MLLLYSLINCLCPRVCNTPSQGETGKFKEIYDGFSKMPAYWWWRTAAPELHHSCHRSTPGGPQGAAPAQTDIAVPAAALHLPSLCFLGYSTELWTQSSATMIQLPQSSMIHSPVKHLQLLALPGCEFPHKAGPPAPAGGRHPLPLLSPSSVYWPLFSSQQRIPLEGNTQACLFFGFTVHSPNKAFPPFTSPFLLAQAL